MTSAVRDADLVYLALPIAGILEVLPAVAVVAKPEALVTDAGSTKAVISREAAKHFTRGARFLGAHPIAGKEISGIENAGENLFRGSRYALIGNESDCRPAHRRLRRHSPCHRGHARFGATRKRMIGR